MMANIPVILVSALNTPEGVQEGLDAGANAYLSKPVAYDDFIETINFALL